MTAKKKVNIRVNQFYNIKTVFYISFLLFDLLDLFYRQFIPYVLQILVQSNE
jgi:hypothetical protein